ncbi:hypothetical protein N0V93_004524 [Gnomoniopsis smithogilvyi]|uniref:Berberine/berberine-like domain-containing protein n=1 Tax=Gnomoniopsis smithogilvyi TaxID=1191159 RepID=A0A9W8YTW0_9PEZI|nr:hypothetical protein N0V93_004524 [Gnomoniopsis smithogilvyi]
MAGVEKAPAYEKWLALPDLIGDTMKMTTVRDMACEYNAEADQNVVMFTLSFKNDARILTRASELHDQLVQDLLVLIPEGDFTTQCAFHPLPKVFSQHSVNAGGNVMGIERNEHDGIVFAAAVFLKTAEQEAVVYPRVAAWIEGIKSYAESIDGMLEWRYANYADRSQNPLASYGEEGVAMLRAAAAKYDPEQVFQTLCPGGFKIKDAI